jgi:plasmid replication initiation protein
MTGRAYSISQLDLFVPALSDIQLRDQREVMERPFFSLSKRKRLTPIHYVSPDGAITVTVEPHQKFGMPTIWDADLLIWAASTLNDMKKRGVNDIPRRLTARPYELLKAIGRDAGGSDCRQLHEAALRLRNVSITTNIRSKTGEKPENFSWLDKVSVTKRAIRGARSNTPPSASPSPTGSMTRCSTKVRCFRLTLRTFRSQAAESAGSTALSASTRAGQGRMASR